MKNSSYLSFQKLVYFLFPNQCITSACNIPLILNNPFKNVDILPTFLLSVFQRPFLVCNYLQESYNPDYSVQKLVFTIILLKGHYSLHLHHFLSKPFAANQVICFSIFLQQIRQSTKQYVLSFPGPAQRKVISYHIMFFS